MQKLSDNVRQKAGKLFTAVHQPWGWSKLEGAIGEAIEMQLGDPSSTGGGTPHLPSDSSGSNTWTPPSVSPKANWFGSWGWAAITSGYTEELHQHGRKKKIIHIIHSYHIYWIQA